MSRHAHEYYPQLPADTSHELREAINRAYQQIYALSRRLGEQTDIAPPDLADFREALQHDPPNVTQWLGVLAQPQIAGTSSGTADPNANDPLSQDGVLFYRSDIPALRQFNATTEPGSWGTISGIGTVTSFSASPASVFDVANATTTPALSLDNQSANTALMGPTSGSPAQPAFRALDPQDTQSVAPTLLASVTINLNTNTKQTLYTVPTGRGCIVTSVVGRQATVDLSGGATGFLTFGFNAGATDWSPGANFVTTGFTTSLKYMVQDQGVASGNVPVPFGGSAAVFGFITNAAFGSTAGMIIDVIGYLF